MKTCIITLAFLFTAISGTPAISAEPFYTSWKDNIAVGGYDTVSFFSGKPQPGKKEFQYTYEGTEWRFSTQGNLDLFKTNPEVFLPQYGGYCAWAVAHNKLAKGNPKHWYVEDGKLYLNFNARIKRRWERDVSGFVSKADTYWPAILNE